MLDPIRAPGRQPATRGSNRFWVALALVAFGLNAIWEIAQRPLYAGEQPITGCLVAALPDAGLTLAAVGLALWLERRATASFWSLALGALLAAALAIEAWALSTGRWSYAPAMPTIGPMGLAPLLQLPLLAALGVVGARRLAGRRGLFVP